MGNGIDISIFSDTREFVTGVKKGVISPLEDVVDTMGDVNRAGDKTGDRIENAMEQARQSVSRFKQEQKEAASGFAPMADHAGEAMQEVKQEGIQNLSETLSSFDGSVTGALDGIQGTFGGIVGSLGPIGMAAGAAGALAIGAISAAFQDSEAHTEEFKQRVSDLTTELIDTGNVGPDAIQNLVDKLKELAAETDDSAVSLTKLRKGTGSSVTDYKELAQALVGAGGNLDSLISKYKDEAAQLRVRYHNSGSLNQELIQQAQAYDQIVTQLEDTKDATNQAQEAQEAYVQAGGPELEQKAQLIDQLNSAYDDAAGAVDDYVNKETGVFDTQKYIDAMNAKLTALSEYQTLLAQSSLSTSAKSYLTSLGSEAASQLMQAYKNGTDAQKRNLDQIWGEAGKSNSAQYVTGVRNAIPDRIDKAPRLGLDTSDASNQLNQWMSMNQGKRLELQISGRTVTGVKVF